MKIRHSHLFITALLSLSLLSTSSWAAELSKKEWYVQLYASSADEQLKDNNSLLGQLQDSSNGSDNHDLEELPPFATPYLTVVFPHPEWEAQAGDYATDYHSTKHKRHIWRFEIRTDKSDRDISLSWNSSHAPQKPKMWLVDSATGTVIKAQGKGKRAAVNHYSFNMDGETVRSFYWVRGGKKLAKKQLPETTR